MRLLEPLDINGMVVPNRIMVPAMVTRLATEEGFVTPAIRDRYTRYAEGETGLIVLEAIAIHKNKSGPLLRISDDCFVPGLSDMVKRIHDTSDSKIVPQLIHFLKIAKSGWRQTVDMLSKDEIEKIIGEFGDAVVRAREAGFDGVELHSAHAYTLASFMSRLNPRNDEYSGKTLEGRLNMIGRVMENIRSKAGYDFPVGVRYLADECIKGGYTVKDAKLYGLRLAQLGFDYLSLSVGGKFEDAVHKEGTIVYPYTGYSGDRCMPGTRYQKVPHAQYSGEIKKFISAKGYKTPIITAGKISDPDDVEKLLADGTVDMVAIARGLLADPDWVKKVRLGQQDRIVKCDYCNVCKQLDGAHKPVHCYLWPKGAEQAPCDEPDADAPHWDKDAPGLSADVFKGTVKLQWSKAEGRPVHYDIYRADDTGEVTVIAGVRTTQHTDSDVLAGTVYHYYVRACSASGQSSNPTESMVVEMEMPHYMLAG
jgi:2,4-dienoyl-CoA reductase-like NADH-dependent reductase (Old Yellow Enzyme family)